jgi:hypothetical protein
VFVDGNPSLAHANKDKAQICWIGIEGGTVERRLGM